MARRKRYKEPGLIEVVIDLAWACPTAGVVASAVLGVIALVLVQAKPADLVMQLAMPLLGMGLGLIAIFGVGVSVIGLIRDELFPRY